MTLLKRQRNDVEPQRRAVALEGFQINLLIVRRAVLPAAVEDPDPLVGQGTNGSVVAHAPLPLLLIVGPCPERLPAGSSGKFVEGLAHELGTGQAPMHPLLLAALLGDRSYAGEFLYVLGAVIAAPVGAESCDQTRGQSPILFT